MHTPAPLQLQQFRQQIKKFVEFSDPEWALFTEHLYLKKLKKKEFFVNSGKVCHEIGFIITGSFRLFFLKDGIEVSNYFCFRNELVSSYRSFLKGIPSPVSVDAMEDAELICFTDRSNRELLNDPVTAYKMERFGRMIAEYLICCYEERVLSFVAQTPEERYLHLLDQQPDFLQKVPQHYLANYLGITPVSLSRIRKRIFALQTKQKFAS